MIMENIEVFCSPWSELWPQGQGSWGLFPSLQSPRMARATVQRRAVWAARYRPLLPLALRKASRGVFQIGLPIGVFQWTLEDSRSTALSCLGLGAKLVKGISYNPAPQLFLFFVLAGREHLCEVNVGCGNRIPAEASPLG